MQQEYQHVDGTFQVTPSIFYQLFTIHIMIHNLVLPMLYPLPPNKQRQSYNHVLSLLKDAVMTEGLTLDPSTVICDYELAIIQAPTLNFPNPRPSMQIWEYSTISKAMVPPLHQSNVGTKR